jgi:hypothetical protein
VPIFSGNFSQDRDAQAPEPVALAIFSRPGLEESLENGGVAGVRQAFKLPLDGRDYHDLNALRRSAYIEPHR